MAMCSRCGNKWKMSDYNTCPVCKEKRDKQREKAYNVTQRNKSSSEVYQSTRWRKLRKEVLLRDLFACVKCGKIVNVKPRDHVVHHKIAIIDGGKPFCMDNTETLCHLCHNREHH